MFPKQTALKCGLNTNFWMTGLLIFLQEKVVFCHTIRESFCDWEANVGENAHVLCAIVQHWKPCAHLLKAPHSVGKRSFVRIPQSVPSFPRIDTIPNPTIWTLAKTSNEANNLCLSCLQPQKSNNNNDDDANHRSILTLGMTRNDKYYANYFRRSFHPFSRWDFVGRFPSAFAALVLIFWRWIWGLSVMEIREFHKMCLWKWIWRQLIIIGGCQIVSILLRWSYSHTIELNGRWQVLEMNFKTMKWRAPPESFQNKRKASLSLSLSISSLEPNGTELKRSYSLDFSELLSRLQGHIVSRFACNPTD